MILRAPYKYTVQYTVNFTSNEWLFGAASETIMMLSLSVYDTVPYE